MIVDVIVDLGVDEGVDTFSERSFSAEQLTSQLESLFDRLELDV